jgi:hypothetical protein
MADMPRTDSRLGSSAPPYSETQDFNILSLAFADNGWFALATIHNLPCYLEALRLRL